jgi:hypothetical protein
LVVGLPNSDTVLPVRRNGVVQIHPHFDVVRVTARFLIPNTDQDGVHAGDELVAERAGDRLWNLAIPVGAALTAFSLVVDLERPSGIGAGTEFRVNIKRAAISPTVTNERWS